MFELWEDKVLFKDGLYVYVDGKGNNSVVSHDCANEIEEDYERYQAHMDIDRGGMKPKYAYDARGFNEDGSKLVQYRTDNIPDNETITPIEGRWIIPFTKVFFGDSVTKIG